MRIITLHQPYATLIALGFKSYETRSWSTAYKGPLAIHAAKRPTNLSELSQIVARTGESPNPAGIYLENALDPFVQHGFPLGKIVAVVDLLSCTPLSSGTVLSIPPTSAMDGQSRLDIEKAVGDWTHGRWAWQLANIRPLSNPLAFRGVQGLGVIQPLVASHVMSRCV